MSVAAEKAAARKLAFGQRAVAHAYHRETASNALNSHLEGLEGQVVAGYLPIRTEADPLPAMVALARNNRVAVPVVAGKGQPLQFREWVADAPLEAGAFGVMVPVSGAELVPDVLIVPLLAYDSRFFRLGYGGGFYDRTLEQLRARGKVRAIGFAYGAQALDSLPLEPTDQPLDEIVTEAGVVPLDPRR